jgi:hypothetical protein
MRDLVGFHKPIGLKTQARPEPRCFNPLPASAEDWLPARARSIRTRRWGTKGRRGVAANRREGEWATRRRGDTANGRHGEWATRRMGDAANGRHGEGRHGEGRHGEGREGEWARGRTGERANGRHGEGRHGEWATRPRSTSKSRRSYLFFRVRLESLVHG